MFGSFKQSGDTRSFCSILPWKQRKRYAKVVIFPLFTIYWPGLSSSSSAESVPNTRVRRRTSRWRPPATSRGTPRPSWPVTRSHSPSISSWCLDTLGGWLSRPTEPVDCCSELSRDHTMNVYISDVPSVWRHVTRDQATMARGSQKSGGGFTGIHWWLATSVWVQDLVQKYFDVSTHCLRWKGCLEYTGPLTPV